MASTLKFDNILRLSAQVTPGFELEYLETISLAVWIKVAKTKKSKKEINLSCNPNILEYDHTDGKIVRLMGIVNKPLI